MKSRPQHPQTLGKIERFWKTLWEELLSRTVFADFADCARRLGLFIDGYNFQRPHQGLAQACPIPLSHGPSAGPIQRREVLGGIIHEYERQAAA